MSPAAAQAWHDGLASGKRDARAVLAKGATAYDLKKLADNIATDSMERYMCEEEARWVDGRITGIRSVARGEVRA